MKKELDTMAGIPVESYWKVPSKKGCKGREELIFAQS
jgi:hypothetical protein